MRNVPELVVVQVQEECFAPFARTNIMLMSTGSAFAGSLIKDKMEAFLACAINVMKLVRPAPGQMILQNAPRVVLEQCLMAFKGSVSVLWAWKSAPTSFAQQYHLTQTVTLHATLAQALPLTSAPLADLIAPYRLARVPALAPPLTWIVLGSADPATQPARLAQMELRQVV